MVDQIQQTKMSQTKNLYANIVDGLFIKSHTMNSLSGAIISQMEYFVEEEIRAYHTNQKTLDKSI